MIMEFSDPHNTRRSATYLPEVAAQEGILSNYHIFQHLLIVEDFHFLRVCGFLEHNQSYFIYFVIA